MKKLLIKPIGLLVVTVLVFAGVFFYAINQPDESDPVDRTSADVETTVEELPEPEDPVVEEVTPISEEDTPVIAAGVLDCSNCWLAPVDKNHSLPSTYAPSVEATGLAGGGSLIPEAAKALRDLFVAATADGQDISIRSAYRSYQTQVTTFEKWVGVEMANGLSRAEAEIEANTYSARPGQSEHQLGTTADLLCTGAGFDSTPCNEEVWQWLVNNAAGYGYVLSYPDGKEDITGYTFEPWHYRYIGVSSATAFTSQTSKTLNLWLAGDQET